jgi:hypothetical protein
MKRAGMVTISPCVTATTSTFGVHPVRESSWLPYKQRDMEVGMKSIQQPEAAKKFMAQAKQRLEDAKKLTAQVKRRGQAAAAAGEHDRAARRREAEKFVAEALRRTSKG